MTDVPNDCPKTREYNAERQRQQENDEVTYRVTFNEKQILGREEVPLHIDVSLADAMRDELLERLDETDKDMHGFETRALIAEAALAEVTKERDEFRSYVDGARAERDRARAALEQAREWLTERAIQARKDGDVAEYGLTMALRHLAPPAEEAHYMGALGNMVPDGIVTGTVRPPEEAQNE